MQIKFITLHMCINKYVYILPEIWLIIFRMTNHIEYFKPGQVFGKEISFQVALTASDEDLNHIRNCLHSMEYNNLRINQLWCTYEKITFKFNTDWVSNYTNYTNYMIIDLDKDYNTISCVELFIWYIDFDRDDSESIVDIDKDSPIKIFTYQEFTEKVKILYDETSDYNPSSPHYEA